MRTPLSAALIAALALSAPPLASAQLLGGLFNRDQNQGDQQQTEAPAEDNDSTGGGLLGGLGNASQDDTDTSDSAEGADTTGTGTDSMMAANENEPQDTGSGPVGTFSQPFAEPTIVVDGEEVATDKRCLEDSEGTLRCKPAAGTLAALGDGRFLYLNALEGTENVELSIVAEFGEVSVNDQTRVLSLDDNDNPTWAKPAPLDGGANPDGRDSDTITGAIGLGQGTLNTADSNDQNDGALFCADVSFLPDGRMIAVGGTDYYSEPGIDGLPLGVVELEGLKASRIFDPETNTWSQSGDMEYGRWYPTTITMADGNLFVASGVTKLLKPVYPDDPLQSGRNVVQTETYNVDEGTWSTNPPSAQRSLPLFPRLHLLPNGQVYYNAGGQAFNPFGQSYDQALWNIVAAYDPDSQQWTDLGYAGLPLKLNEIGLGALTSTLNPTNLGNGSGKRLLGDLVGQTLKNPLGAVKQLLSTPIDGRELERAIGSGMRGSTNSTMLPLRPDENGGYHEAEFLTSGGIPTYVTVGSPGGYLPLSSSRIDTVTVNGDDMGYESRLTGPLNRPRWYSYSVLLPDDSVMVFSGGTRDGVVLPGLEGAIKQAERFDLDTETWSNDAVANRPRTYHNNAVLMPDGRVLVGGHSPINTAYLSFIQLKQLGFADYAGRDPSFEIYTPPYAARDDRPVIEDAPTELATDGETFNVTVNGGDVDEVQLVHRNATTHVVKSNQRSVVLPIVSNDGNELTVQMTGNPAVLPPGPYMLFVSKQAEDGMRVPSESTPVIIQRSDGSVEQPEPIGTGSDSMGGGLLDGLNIGGSENSRATGGPVSPLLPVTDLATGALGLLPSPTELLTGLPSTLGVLADTGKDGAAVLGEEAVKGPGAVTDELTGLADRGDSQPASGSDSMSGAASATPTTTTDDSAPSDDEASAPSEDEGGSGLLGGLLSGGGQESE